MTDLREFRIDVPGDVLEDIRSGVERWPSARLRAIPEEDGWAAGPPPSYIAKFKRHWIHDYDWRAQERRLNRLRQHRVTIDGLDLHFILEPGSGPAPQSLLLLHGWPYCFASFADLVDPLAHPERHGGRLEDAFTVVTPSLPGFGFSQTPTGPMGPRAMMRLIHQLMTEVLGLTDYIVHGGDWGGYMASIAGLDYPDAVKGVHTTFVALRDVSAPLQTGQVSPDADPVEKAFVARESALQDAEGAYSAVQSTKPLALAALMIDNPVGVAVWMIDKFHAWSDRRDMEFEAIFPFDRLITEVMLYLVTGTFDSATWIYAASRSEGLVTLPPGRRVEVPTAVAAFPDPIFPVPPRAMVERSHNVVRYTEMPHGGHFPFYEAPALLIDDLRAFAALLKLGDDNDTR